MDYFKGRLHGARSHSGASLLDSYPAPVYATARVSFAPTHDAIARLAYSYWEARGRIHGFDREDWFRAERELRDGSTLRKDHGWF